MSVEKLKRVLWRLRVITGDNSHPYNSELKKAILYECGTDPKTFRNNRKALKDLGWIKPYNKKRITLTDKDLTES